ncbi:MAG: hypothetical protein DRI57_21650 [Deltaproteobacteria bacterium]|nr:MAG: hypothetical protein DRI57_21650 [Deltaproteobacteria bacterium]
MNESGNCHKFSGSNFLKSGFLKERLKNWNILIFPLNLLSKSDIDFHVTRGRRFFRGCMGKIGFGGDLPAKCRISRI